MCLGLTESSHQHTDLAGRGGTDEPPGPATYRLRSSSSTFTEWKEGEGVAFVLHSELGVAPGEY